MGTDMRFLEIKKTTNRLGNRLQNVIKKVIQKQKLKQSTTENNLPKKITGVLHKAMTQQEDIQHAVPNIVNAMQETKEKETAFNQQDQWRKEKLQMIDRDIAQAEAWTNATALRYK